MATLKVSLIINYNYLGYVLCFAVLPLRRTLKETFFCADSFTNNNFYIIIFWNVLGLSKV